MGAFRIISIDGGGMRGVVPLVALRFIQDKWPDWRPDLYAGTSTGAIIAVASGCGRTARGMLDVYVNRGTEIFPDGWLYRLLNTGACSPKHSDKGLTSVLASELVGRSFGSCVPNVMATTYNATTRGFNVFKSWREEHGTIPAWEVAAASASAPVYLPPHDIAGHLHIDGGVGSTNPAMCAVAEAVRLGASLEDVRLLSLGTGIGRETPFECKRWGALGWNTKLIDALLDASADSVHYQCTQLLEGRYARVQVPLSVEHGMDDASPRKLRELIATAERDLVEHNADIIEWWMGS